MPAYKNMTYDNTDQQVILQGYWDSGAAWNASGFGESGTLALTRDLNANITFIFPVPAIAFYYYGIERCCGALYNICIDCYPDEPNYTSIDALHRRDDGHYPPIVLFSTRFETPAVHEIIIINTNDTRVNPSGNSQLTIDRIDLEIVDDTSVTTTASSAISSKATSVTTTPPSATGSQKSSHSSPMASIVGGALVAGFVVVVIMLFLFWFRLRQRRKASTQSTGPLTPYSVEPLEYHPSLLPSKIVAPAMVDAQNFATLPTTNAQYPARYGYTSFRPGKGAQDRPSVSAPAESSSSQLPPPPRSNQARREQDAGPLLVDVEEATLPPGYNQVFLQSIRS